MIQAINGILIIAGELLVGALVLAYFTHLSQSDLNRIHKVAKARQARKALGYRTKLYYNGTVEDIYIKR